MATLTFEKIAGALAHLAIIRQATSDDGIKAVCVEGANTISAGIDEAVITSGVDPEADLQNISFQPIYSAIDECNKIADSSSSPSIKESCNSMAAALTAVIQKLI